jgi:hypothetical protein
MVRPNVDRQQRVAPAQNSRRTPIFARPCATFEPKEIGHAVATCRFRLRPCGRSGDRGDAHGRGNDSRDPTSGAPAAGACTLAQAIYAANLASNPTNPKPAGATTITQLSDSTVTTMGVGACTGATAGTNTIDLSAFAGQTLTYSAADNHWYGSNALPPIASAITIEGHGAIPSVTALRACAFSLLVPMRPAARRRAITRPAPAICNCTISR